MAEHLLSSYMEKDDPVRYRRFLLRCVGDTEKQRMDCVLGSSTRWASLSIGLAALGLLVIIPSFFLMPSAQDVVAFALFITGFTIICVSAILGVAVMDELRLLLKYGARAMVPVEIRAARRNRAVATVGIVVLAVTTVGLMIFRFTGA